MSDPRERLDLLDWKDRVFRLYAAVRDAPDPREARRLWRQERYELFRSHPQSPIPPERRSAFAGLDYFDYRPDWRLELTVDPAPPERYEIPSSTGEPDSFERFGTVSFEVDGSEASLELYWLEGYGGGLFVPLADATSGASTYGGGRYLLATVKGADLGRGASGRLVFDFNFAYQPSCSYDPRWSCPLAPPANRLAVPVEAGERL